MSRRRREVDKLQVLVVLGLMVGLFSIQGQQKLPAEDEPAPSPIRSYPAGATKDYTFYTGAKPKLVKEGPVNERAVAKGATEFIDGKLSKEKLKTVPGSGLVVRIGAKWSCLYNLQYGGVPLAKDSSAHCLVSADGECIAFRQRGIPREVDATEATVDAKAAVNLAVNDFRERSKVAKPDVGQPSLEVWVDQEKSGHLCWKITILGGARYWVTATGEAKVLISESVLHNFSEHAGTVTGTGWAETPLRDTASLPLGFLDVTRKGLIGSARPTAMDGRFSFNPGEGDVEIEGTLAGEFCRILNKEKEDGGDAMKRSSKGKANTALALDFTASAEFDLAQVTAFHWVNIAHDFGKEVLLPSHLWQLPTQVNLDPATSKDKAAQQGGNAFFDSSNVGMFLYRAFKGKQNTASPDVIVHEYGHGIDHVFGGIHGSKRAGDKEIPGPDGETGGSAYSEGFGDTVALLITRQPRMGRDIGGKGTSIRSAQNDVTYRKRPNADSHTVGQAFSGFVFEFIEQLKKTSKCEGEDPFAVAKRLALQANAQDPGNIPEAVLQFFLADDDDGDLTNGSPHFAQLAAAADAKEIPRPPDPTTAGPPRFAYVGCCGTHHLVEKAGTASYRWNCAAWLTTLHFERADDNFFYYCEKEFGDYKWAFARNPDCCGKFAVWFFPDDETTGRWVLFQHACRETPINADEKVARQLRK